MALSRPFKEDQRALPLSTPLFQAIDGVMSLALCPLVVFQAPQHFSSSETQATCDGRMAVDAHFLKVDDNFLHCVLRMFTGKILM